MAPVGRSLTPDEVETYDHVPAAVARRARLHRVRWLASGAHGMTLGRHVLLVRGHEDRPPLIAHELVHVRQYAETGTLRFLVAYLGHYVRNVLGRVAPDGEGVGGRTTTAATGETALRSASTPGRHRAAYLAIPAETEARAEAARWASGHREAGR